MRLKINLAKSIHKKQPVSYVVYTHLLLFLVITLAGNYYWYSSLQADIARYNERLNKIEERASLSKNMPEESVSQKEKEPLLKEAAFINAIIKSKALSWSGLLAQLEQEVIPNISLINLAPKVVEDKVRIGIRGVGKDLETITRFMDKLERSPSFQGVFLSHSTGTELNGEKLVNFVMELEYREK